MEIKCPFCQHKKQNAEFCVKCLLVFEKYDPDFAFYIKDGKAPVLSWNDENGITQIRHGVQIQ